MANSALHAITIDNIRISNPGFHHEYCLLIEGISKLIQKLVKKHADLHPFSSFTETYDRDKVEPVLQIVICTTKDNFNLQIHINQDCQFVIGNASNGNVASTSSKALTLVEVEVKKVGWL